MSILDLLAGVLSIACVISGFVALGLRLQASLGWGVLSRRYRSEVWPPEGVRVEWQSLGVGAVRYLFTIEAVVTDQRLFLWRQKGFRLFHPPVSVPWTDIRTRRGVLVGMRVALKKGGSFTAYGDLADAIEKAAHVPSASEVGRRTRQG